jgi:replicative DNA helicase
MRISSENIRNRCMTEKEWEKYLKYVSSKDFQEIQEHLTIPVSANLDIGKIEETVEKSKADIVFIDYLGLIKGDVYKQNTYEQISDISRRLKLLAIETKKPIVVLHQLNRDMKDRADKRPKLSDIRDSGKIEQDADFITFVYRPAYFNINEDKTAMEFIVGKARHTNGAGQCANLCFLGQYQKITEIGGKSDF